MEQMISLWSGLTAKRRVIVIVATFATMISVLMLAKIASTPRMALLYAGLDSTAAGEVVAALDARGVITDIRGSAIYVEAKDRDALRLSLAGEGLPQNGAQGYELLDSLTGFGTTAQMFDAAYWRAKEGELARTILSNRQVSAVRVHLSNPANDPFRQGQIDAASVTVTLSSGQVSAAQAMALRYLVASAVAGLQPDQVAVIDSGSGLISTTDASVKPAGLAEARAEAIRASVIRMLEARVGRGAAVVEVSVEPITEREEITERQFDPQSRVAISSEIEDVSNNATNSSQGAVTVASNLPDGDGGGSSRGSESNETRTRELFNYEVSETQRAVIREPGAVRRITVAVLVDGERVIADDNSVTWQPRSDAELADLKELVASAVGYDEERGDQITIRNMEFSPVPAITSGESAPLFSNANFDLMKIAQIAVFALVSLILGLFVVRPILLAPPQPTPAQIGPPDLPSSIPGMLGSESPKIGEVITDDEAIKPIELAAIPDEQGGPDPAQRLRNLIEEKQEETVEVLNQWMNDPREVAR